MRKIFLLLPFFVYLFSSLGYAQVSDGNSPFREVTLKVDTATYSLSRNLISFNNEYHLPFQYKQEDEISEIRLYPFSFNSIENISLARSADYELLDSVVNVNNAYYRVKVRFKNLTSSQFLNLTFAVYDTTSAPAHIETIKLFPYTKTTVNFYPESEELFVGEEKIFELVTNNIKNVKVKNEWVKSDDIDYRVSESNGVLRLHLHPNDIGRKTLKISLQTNKPFLNPNGQIVYQLPVIEKRFEVKGSRLKFLNLDRKEVTLDEVSRQKGTEVMIDNHWALSLQKTYRIEAQEEAGGALVGEIFTRRNVANNRVLCWLRLYNYHRISEGYLYIKDGDEPKFITNFNITPKTTISSISIMHEGGDWTNNLSVNPGETINLKIEGQGLHKARFQFDDLTDITSDSSLRTEEISVYRFKVPISIQRKKINIYNRAVNTGFSIAVKEFQRPRPFDFITLDYGDVPNKVSALFDGPLFYDHTIRDVIFTFNPNLIDSETRLYGKQYLDFDIRITNSKNELIDQRRIEDILICPGENSPRYSFYTDKQCYSGNLSLNKIIGRKTYDLDDWSRIQITIKHDKDKHGDEGQTKNIDIVLRKKIRFDIDVSFPTGLLVKSQGSTGYGDFSGISMTVNW